MLRKPSAELIGEKLKADKGLLVDEVPLRTSVRMYPKVPSCLIIRNKDKIIQNMIFFSYHGMWSSTT